MRKSKKWNWDKKLPRPRCPRCRRDVLVIVDGKKWQAECESCGIWSKEQMADYRLAKTAGGREYWLVSNLAVIDEHPALLASGMPIFLDIEPAPTRESWDRRVKALQEDREFRKTNPKWTVFGFDIVQFVTEFLDG